MTRRWSGWWWAALVAVLFGVAQVALAPAAVIYPDTARYAAAALEHTGIPRPQAEATASAMLCADRGEQTARANAAITLPLFTPTDPAAVTQACNAAAVGRLEPTDDPRYRAIFDTRPGYPWAVAQLLGHVELTVALWAVPVAATVIAGLLLFVALRTVGASAPAAAGGQLLLYVSPAGWWGVQPLTEGLVLAGAAAVLAGALLAAAGRRAVGTLLLAAGLGVVAATKYSTVLPLAAGVAVAAVCCWWIRRRDRPGLAAVALVSGGSAAGVLWASRHYGWPGLAATAQDLFTVHYALPDVPDIAGRLVAANLAYWQRWPLLTPANLALAAGLAVAVWAGWRRWPLAGLLLVAVAVVGPVLTVAHPDVYEGDRLYSLAWLAVAAGLPLASRSILRRSDVPARAPHRPHRRGHGRARPRPAVQGAVRERTVEGGGPATASADHGARVAEGARRAGPRGEDPGRASPGGDTGCLTGRG